MQRSEARAIKDSQKNTRADPVFDRLGPRPVPGGTRITVFAPDAERMVALAQDKPHELTRHGTVAAIFEGEVPGQGDYRLRKITYQGETVDYRDPHSFGPVLGALDDHLIAEGTHDRLWQVLGAHVIDHEGARGTHFALWAPHAQRVSVLGDFNDWDGRGHGMTRRSSGVWEIFVPDLGEGALYKYALIGADGTPLPLKADPVGFGAQHRPETASVVRNISGYGWRDTEWMQARAQTVGPTVPVSIYEVHLGSWRRDSTQGGRPISYKEAARELVDYVHDLGFTHIELLPISEHPFDGSWGYQPVGLFAPSVRHGPPHEFRDLVDAAHRKGLGVLLDWVPAHFPADAHGLSRFDGTPLYEYADPREGFHRDWNTLIYDFGRPEIANFLTSNARYWLEEYHADGLRVDAVASMLYRDYSREPNEWIPNTDGGRENYEAIALLKRMTAAVRDTVPGAMTVAEESTAFPSVTRKQVQGGLGFDFKWNMGWMNDTLGYIAKDPVHREHHHHQITFGLTYAFSENFVLPISHDEVVHGKGSMLGKMPGTGADRFANLRAYYGFMWGHPGKKLLFMGQEFAQPEEWNFDAELSWSLLKDPRHAGVQTLVRDLNRLYRETPALHAADCSADGFEWLLPDAAQDTVFAWLRKAGQDDAPVAVVCNFSPVLRRDYPLGLPRSGNWREVLNTDATCYGGTGAGNMGQITAQDAGAQGQPAEARVTLPPLSVLMFTPGD